MREERANQATQAQKSFEKTVVFGALIPYMDQQDETPHLQRLIDRIQHVHTHFDHSNAFIYQSRYTTNSYSIIITAFLHG